MNITNDLVKTRIINNENIILRWPKKNKDKACVLEMIAEHFLFDTQYSEKDVNEIIKSCIAFDDYALIRRELFDRGYIHRTPDCKTYWKERS